MEIQFTPGSWKMSSNSIAKTGMSSISNPIFYLNVISEQFKNNQIIAKCLGRNKDELLANTKLISAAPDLFDAAFDAQNFIMNSGDISPQALDVINKLQQAIFKAIK